jgi:sodium transport system ATP-binding protein
MREAERLCDRIAILHRGHILAEGPLAELREQFGENDLEELFFGLISQHDGTQCGIRNSECGVPASMPAIPHSALRTPHLSDT